MRKIILCLAISFNIALGGVVTSSLDKEEINQNFAATSEIQSKDIPDIPSVH